MQKDEKQSILEQTTATAPQGAEAQGPEQVEAKKSVSRRGFCIGIGGIAALGVLGGLRYVGHTPLVRPPGGTDESHLISGCIRCEKCYEACPRDVIMPAHIEDGLLGMRTPKLNFDASYCNFCADEYGGVPHCVQVCPTGALTLGAEFENGCVLSDEDADPAHDGTVRKKIKINLGKAEIDTNTCMAYRNTGCRKCYDNCPFGAISLNTDGSSVNPIPVVDSDKCNGCGACQSVCISLTAGSIVEGATERAIVVRPAEDEG